MWFGTALSRKSVQLSRAARPVEHSMAGRGEGGGRGVAGAGKTEETAVKPMESAGDEEAKGDALLVKVGMVGDAQVGKTSLMVRYVEGKFDEDYIETLGVNFMEKTIKLPRAEVTFSVWDLGGAREFVSMLPLACNDAVAVLFVFDLTRKSTLMSVKEWYRQVRGLNKTAFPFLVGTKFDIFVRTEETEQAAVLKQARKYAKAMKAPLIFTSASVGINVQKIFKLVFSKVFNVRASIPTKSAPGEPILEY